MAKGGRRSRRTGPVRARRWLLAAIAAMSFGTAAATIATAGPPAAPAGLPAGAVAAAAFDGQSGARVEGTVDVGGGQDVGWLARGDWLRYDHVDLGAAGGPVTLALRLAAAYADRPGTVEARLDAVGGRLLASVPVVATGGWQSWTTVTAPAISPGGSHTLYLVMRSAQAGDFVNLHWFAAAGPGITPTPPSPSVSPPSVSPPSASPSAASPSASGGMTMPPAPAGAWVPVDGAAWQAQLAAFRATTPRAVPAGARHNPEFNATCTYSHSAADDPIVFPGQKGASHLHSFLGNGATDANTTAADLMRFTASSCRPLQDHSAYWIPTLFEHGTALEPEQVIVYYGSLLKDPTGTVPMPNGLRMIAGDAKRQEPTPAGAVNQFYCAGGPQDGRTRSADGNWPVCEGGTLHFTLRFPDCWDGKHLDSPTHKQHVSFGAGGVCPAAFPVPIPAVTFSIAYRTGGSADGFRLSSGLPSSMHGDAFFAWDEAAMAHRVKDCVVQAVPCNTAGEF